MWASPSPHDVPWLDACRERCRDHEELWPWNQRLQGCHLSVDRGVLEMSRNSWSQLLQEKWQGSHLQMYHVFGFGPCTQSDLAHRHKHCGRGGWDIIDGKIVRVHLSSQRLNNLLCFFMGSSICVQHHVHKQWLKCEQHILSRGRSSSKFLLSQPTLVMLCFCSTMRLERRCRVTTCVAYFSMTWLFEQVFFEGHLSIIFWLREYSIPLFI